MTQLYKTKSSASKVNSNQLFSGIWIRWQALTLGERFVCANIILIPLWWVVGIYDYMSTLLLLSVAVYDWQKYREIRLKRPSLPVAALLAFGLYQTVGILLIYSVPGRDTFSNVFILSICPALWLWYIQSNNIRIRLEPVAWACTVSVIQMLVFWGVIALLPESVFLPHNVPTLYAQLSNKRVEDTGFMNNNNPFYLLPYQMEGEIRRYNIFFVFPEYFAVVTGFMGLVALDIKNRLWSSLLLFVCVFFIFGLSGTRMVWIAFPVTVALRYVFSNFSKPLIPAIAFALVAVVSFTTLSFPPVTDLIVDQFTQSTQAIGEVRANSTEARMEIYRRTWQAIQEDDDKLIWGHATKGPTIDPSNAVAKIGSHSFILGNLIYVNGIVGTTIFAVFWFSLCAWFYQTRVGRPLCCVSILVFYMLIAPTLELVYGNATSSLLILLGAAMRRPQITASRKITSWASF